jgi:hypothetical protein
MDDERFWPFPIVGAEAEWDEFTRDYVSFMRRAFEEGFRPRARSDNFIAAESLSGRSLAMIFRGSRNGWEVDLRDSDGVNPLGSRFGIPYNMPCVCGRPPFRTATHLALAWLRGHDLESILSEFEFVGGRPPGLKLKLP